MSNKELLKAILEHHYTCPLCNYQISYKEMHANDNDAVCVCGGYKWRARKSIVIGRRITKEDE